MDISQGVGRGHKPSWDALTLKASIGDADHAAECQRILGNDWDHKRDLVWSLKDDAGQLIAAMVTQNVTCNATGRNKIHIFNLVGNGFPEWGSKCLPIIEKYARDCGAYSITIAGRKGWARILPGFVRNEDGILERVL